MTTEIINASVIRYKLASFVRSNLREGNLVITSGASCTGKTWLIHQTVNNDSIIDKKSEALRDDRFNIKLSEYDKILVRTHESIAIDEAQLFKKEDMLELAAISSDHRNGLLLAVQDASMIPEAIFKLFMSKNTKVILIKLETFFMKSNFNSPTWKAYEIIFRDKRYFAQPIII